MVGSVALAGASSVVPLITQFSLSKAAKPMRCNQPAGTDLHDGFLLLPRQRSLWQRYCEDLIGSHRRVVADARCIDHIETATRTRIPKPREAFLDLLGHL